jgi:uncharacterized protein (TIGR01777 family)
MKTVALNGSSGFLGSQICEYFGRKYLIVRLNREDYLSEPALLAKKLQGVDIVINLAGARISLFSSQKKKEVMYESRIKTTRNLCEAIELMDVKPELFISMSAVGIYDFVHLHDENSKNYGNDFLAALCIDWEDSVRSTSFYEKTLIIRNGIVLSSEGGMFKKMITPFKIGLGAILGTGKQAFPFIHILDFLGAIDFAIDYHLVGIINFVAPVRCTNREFSKAVCTRLGMPLLLKLAPFLLKILIGEQSSMLLEGQKVIPKVLKDEGYQFQFPDIDSTINDLIKLKN